MRTAILHLLVLGFAGARVAPAAVSDMTFSDVTPRAFSVIWVSDEPVLGAAVNLFEDQDGSIPSPAASAMVLSPQPALDAGIVKMDVKGLSADTCFYVQTQTTSASGVSLLPAAPPLAEVCTESTLRKSSGTGQPITNDLLVMDLLAPDGSSADGALVVVSIPSIAAHPLSAFLGSGFAQPRAVVNLNNLFDQSLGETTSVLPGEILEIREYRGLLCPDLQDHVLLRFRVVPSHEEVATVGTELTELEAPKECFFADAVCDGGVDILDVQRVLNIFGSTAGACAFNPDLDIVGDGEINILDFQSILNRLGDETPPQP